MNTAQIMCNFNCIFFHPQLCSNSVLSQTHTLLLRHCKSNHATSVAKKIDVNQSDNNNAVAVVQRINQTLETTVY